MKVNFNFRKAVTVISLAAFCLVSSPVAQATGVPPLSLAQMYSLASGGNVRALRAAVQRGLNIDSTDRFGNTGMCHAVTQNNSVAYNAFRAAGANPNSPCVQNIPPQQYDRFMAQSRVAPATDTPRQAYNKFNEGEFIISKSTWVIGGLLLAGGAVLAFSGGGGGGGHAYYAPAYIEPSDSLAKFAGTKVPNTPESSPYTSVVYLANNNSTVVNKKEGADNHDFAISNNSSIKVTNADGTEEDKKLVDLINLNGNILENTAYLQVAMKAGNGSTVINGTAADGTGSPLITLGDATAGLVADDRSFATNYGTLKIAAQNATIAMIAGNHSVANNIGEINMAFKGYHDTDSIIGMYADTYSSLINNGNITGNTIDVSGLGGTGTGTGGTGTGTGTGGTGTDPADAPTNAGTLIGMEVRTVNEVPDAVTSPVTATNNKTITLNAQSSAAAIRTSLVGMGGYLDKGFLDGTKIISRASSLYLNNNNTITLNYTLTGTGTYAPTDNTLLNGGGGIIGMRSDAKTDAINNNTINLLMSSGVNNAGAGMLSVHGGSITNHRNINITGGEGNYGMLSVRGKGSNAEIDSLLPLLLNDGTIHVISTNGYGMASYNGGVVTNSGNITLDNTGTGMRTNTGTLINNSVITLNNNGSGMVLKSGDPSTDASSGGTPPVQDLTNSVANNKGLITIDNADDAKGIFIEDGKAINSGTGIKITNTRAVPAASSYGIKAEKGSVENNSLIDMNVLVSTDGTTSVDSYGIFSDSANISNTVGGSIVFRKRGTGIATTSGRVVNMGKVTLEQGGTGISSNSGNVYNTETGVIEINDNATAVSTGISSQSGIITNDGKIKITGGNGATGIKAGLLVNNNKSIELTGRNITGIELTGQDAIANNNQDIIIVSTGISAADKYSYGIKAGASVDNATITNNHNISLTGTTDLSNLERGYGISIANGTAYNYGTIIFDNMYGWGMATTVGTAENHNKIRMNSGGYGMYANGSGGQIINSATGNIELSIPDNSNLSETFGLYADGGATAFNKGEIIILSNSSPSLMLTHGYGIYVKQGNATNQGKITINGSNSTGMAYGGSTISDTIQNMAGGVINMDGSDLTGMNAYGGTAINSGIINVGTSTTASTAPNSVGMLTSGGIITNQSVINVNSNSSVGMKSVNSSGVATNNGIINVRGSNSYGMYASAGQIINSATGTINITNIDNTSIGMFATGSGSSIINNGNIIINGTSIIGSPCGADGCGNYIKVADGATFTNNARVVSTFSLDFDGMSSDDSGTIMIGRGGSFEAPEISGDVTADSSIVKEGNSKEYVNENSFVGEDEGIKLNSGSYLFDAYLKKNEDGNQDVVMSMKDFSDVVDNSSVANFLSTNYDLGNNLDMYGILKSAADASSFTVATAEQMGLNLMPSFAKQNMDIVKAVNNHMSQTLFANQDAKDIRAMFNYVYDNRQQDGVNMLSGYKDQSSTAYGLFDRKYNNNFRYGIGVSLTSYNSDYDNGSSRDEVIAQVLTPLIYTTEGLKAISMPRLGMGWGEYKRKADGDEYKADTKNYYYGISNEIRKEFVAGPVTLEPTAEFNILGLYQDRTKEKAGLDVKSANNVSVESGIGMYVKKSFSIKQENDLSFRAGGSWYHEFNNPYKAARARIAGMLGAYQMDTYDVQRDRGVLSIRTDYRYNALDFFFEASKFLEEDDGYALSAGLGYKF